MTDDTNQPTSKNLEQSFKNLRTFIKDQHESLEKSHLRAIQHKTFTCAAECTSNYNLPHRQTSNCLEKCFDPFKKAEHLIKDSTEHIDIEINKCMDNCKIDADFFAKEKGLNFDDKGDAEKIRRKFYQCGMSCPRQVIPLISNAFYVIKQELDARQ